MKIIHTVLFSGVRGALIIGIAVFLIPSYTLASGVDMNSEASTTLSTPAIPQTSAALTLTINSIPDASTTSTIGSCVVTYSSSVADNLDCSGNLASINILTNNTPATLAAALSSLGGVVDANHGPLTESGSDTDATFSTDGVEIATSTIDFVDGTAGAVTSTATTTGVIPVAQINTITIAGTVDPGDIFQVYVPTGIITYTTQSSDSSDEDIAEGLNAAITATSTNLDFTNATSSGATIILTSKTPGIAFTQTSSTIHASTTTAGVPSAPPEYESGISGGGGSGGGSSHPFVPSIHTKTIPTVVSSSRSTVSISGASAITKTLHLGSRNKSVTLLQKILLKDPTLGFTGAPSGYYGVKTRSAVEAFQLKYTVATRKSSGYGSLGPKTRAMLLTVFGQ
jgi:hypothetical protein